LESVALKVPEPVALVGEVLEELAVLEVLVAEALVMVCVAVPWSPPCWLASIPETTMTTMTTVAAKAELAFNLVRPTVGWAG
jgi:hypothetical protein